MNKIFILLFFIMISGCATPPGQMKRDDFTWTTINTSIGYQEAYRRIKDGFRTCAWPVDSELYTDNKSGYFDIFIPGMFREKTAWVAGRINITENSAASSTVSIGVISRYMAKDTFKTEWSGYLDKKYCE